MTYIIPVTKPFFLGTMPTYTVPVVQQGVLVTVPPPPPQPRQQYHQQLVILPVQNQQPAATVQIPVYQAQVATMQVPTGGQNSTCCWMHRAPGEAMRLAPPPVGRPGQWVQFADGGVHWVPPKKPDT